MASTNKTTNLQLSQFTSTDKPAWLGDYNQDMSKIDTAVHGNSQDITTLGTSVSTMQTSVSANTSAIETLQTGATAMAGDISTLQSGATSMAGDISTLQSSVSTQGGQIETIGGQISALDSRLTADESTISTNTSDITTNANDITTLTSKLNALVNKFDLSNITTQAVSQIWSGMGYTTNDVMTLAQNDDGSLFKFYGTLGGVNDTGSTKTKTKVAVAGLSGMYGIKTSLHLNTAPQNAYIVSPLQEIRGTNQNVAAVWGTSFAVGTDGYIYVYVNSSQSFSMTNGSQINIWHHPCIYFNENFGDIPTPPTPES